MWRRRLLTASLVPALSLALPAQDGGFLAPRPAPAMSLLDRPPELAGAVGHSLAFLARPDAAKVYGQRRADGFTLERVRRALARFRDLDAAGLGPAEFLAAVREDFAFRPAAGADGAGGVLFTGYFEPVYEASRTPSAAFRFPLYRRPQDFQAWPRPHPTRLELVGADGLQGAQGPLKGLELVWLKDRFQAFLAEVQGSARLRLPDGATMTVGNAGVTDHPYVSIGKLLAADPKVKLSSYGMPAIAAYFEEHPEALGACLARCDRMAFFRDTQNHPPSGSLGVPLTARCSVAADPEVFPPGSLALIELDLPVPRPGGGYGLQKVQRFVLVQDAGGAIKGPGRFDCFLGSGGGGGRPAQRPGESLVPGSKGGRRGSPGPPMKGGQTAIALGLLMI
jgi:membrane-bound lytic murein transglycosylase A